MRPAKIKAPRVAPSQVSIPDARIVLIPAPELAADVDPSGVDVLVVHRSLVVAETEPDPGTHDLPQFLIARDNHRPSAFLVQPCRIQKLTVAKSADDPVVALPKSGAERVAELHAEEIVVVSVIVFPHVHAHAFQ